MIDLERKKRLLRSAFSNGLDFLDGMYVINDNPIGRDEVEELASDVEAMVEWYFKYLNQADAEHKAYQQGRADAIEPIEKELMHWEDWILAESPTGFHDVKEYSADDMQRMICRTIRECKEAIEEQIKEQKNE